MTKYLKNLPKRKESQKFKTKNERMKIKELKRDKIKKRHTRTTPISYLGVVHTYYT